MQTAPIGPRTTPSSRLAVSRDWLFGAHSFEYHVAATLAPSQLSSLIDETIRALLPAAVLEMRACSANLVTIDDLKGRDPNNLIVATAAEEAPQSEELMFIAGTTRRTLDDSGEVFDEPFEVRLHTSFREFSANNHITHSVHLEQHGSLPNSLPIKLLGRAFPLSPTRFRLGLDLFTPSTMLGWFSGTPTVSQTLLIEASTEQLHLKIASEKLHSRSELPLLRDSRRVALQQALVRSIGFDWISDVRRLAATG